MALEARGLPRVAVAFRRHWQMIPLLAGVVGVFLASLRGVLGQPTQTACPPIDGWSPPRLVSNSSASDAARPRLAVGAVDATRTVSGVHIVWDQTQLGGGTGRDIWYRTFEPGADRLSDPYRVDAGIAPDISVGLDNDVHLVWFIPDTSGSSQGKLVYRSRGVDWSPGYEEIDTSAVLQVDSDGGPAVVTTTLGIYVVWPQREAVGPRLYSAYKPSRSVDFSGRSPLFINDIDASLGTYPRLAAGPGGVPSLVWLHPTTYQGQTTNQIRGTDKPAGEPWSPFYTDISLDYGAATQRVAGAPALTGAPDGTLFVVWESTLGSDQKLYYSTYRYDPTLGQILGWSWDTPLLLQDGDGSPTRPNVSYGHQAVFAVWRDQAAAGAVRVQTASAPPNGYPPIWSSPTPLALSNVHDRSIVTADANGTRYLLYVQKDNAGVERVCLTWQPGTIPPTPTAPPSPTPTTAPPTASPTATRTVTVTPTPGTPTLTRTATLTRTPAPSRTPSPTVTPTTVDEGSPTVTPTITMTATETLPPDVTGTATPTPTVSPNGTPTRSPTPTRTLTATATPTRSPTPTRTPTATATPSIWRSWLPYISHAAGTPLPLP